MMNAIVAQALTEKEIGNMHALRDFNRKEKQNSNFIIDYRIHDTSVKL